MCRVFDPSTLFSPARPPVRFSSPAGIYLYKFYQNKYPASYFQEHPFLFNKKYVLIGFLKHSLT
ncbi:hypothetical protein RHMOL_Rhmol07G0209100 [Rhododendron molle]|uniref:Uncharacterized protein n=1 Tax=Rhododendron molle TaxID=49168 RepID=A0ACC0N2Z4_RHOML|nr:hypothetical protein RHMOL_Rhmol07G0209100 [Rhododendron molle]